MPDPLAREVARLALLTKYGKAELDVQKDMAGKEYIYDENMRRRYIEEELQNQK